VIAEHGEHRVAGLRCSACRYPVVGSAPHCPVCRGSLETGLFGPEGTVWSHTTVRVAVSGREPPYTLAYVDLDDGPRILAHAAGPVEVGDRVRLTGTTADGDPEVARA